MRSVQNKHYWNTQNSIKYHNQQQPNEEKLGALITSSLSSVPLCSFTRLMGKQSFIISAIVPAGIGGIWSTDGPWICTGQCLATNLSGGWPSPPGSRRTAYRFVYRAGRRIIKSSRRWRVYMQIWAIAGSLSRLLLADAPVAPIDLPGVSQ